jgi:hypothetical protein
MGPTLRPCFALSRRRGLEIVLCMQSDFCKSFYDNGSSSSDQGYKNRSVFSKIVEKWQNRIGSNLKTVENTVHCFKISEKDKNQ